jgi:TonB-dependent receptor
VLFKPVHKRKDEKDEEVKPMRKYLYSAIILAFTVHVLWPISVIAQSGKGSLSGIAKDPAGYVLPGAMVDVQPIGKRVVTNDQGNFRITDLSAGEYSVTVTYVGFTSFKTTAMVNTGRETTVDAVLKVALQTDQIVVTAERPRGEAEAINIERTADNIVQVLPSKVITSLPNTNVADAVGRLPSVTLERDEGEGKYVQIRGTEPRLSNMTINGIIVPSPEGNVRNIKMDIIPSDLVDRIEVSKTLSANQDGDAIGGSVNLVTKTAGDRPYYSLATQGGYTDILNGRWLSGFSGTMGQRFGAQKKLGILMGGTYDYNGRAINDLEPAPGTTQVNGTGKWYPVLSGADMRTYKYYRTRYGFDSGVDYHIKPGSSLYLKGLYSDFHDYGDVWVYSPGVGNLVQPPNGSQYTFDNTGGIKYRQYVRRPDQQIFSVSMGGNHDLQATVINYDFAVSRSHNIGGQDFATTRFANANNYTVNLNTSGPYRPQFPVAGGANLFDPTQFTVSQYLIPKYHSSQLNFEGTASLSRRYRVHSHFATFELGAKVRNGHKNQYENDLIYNNPSVNLQLSQVLSTLSNSGYYDKSYQFGPLSDANKINSLVLSNLATGFKFDAASSAAQSIPANYDANERVYAGYAMNTIGFGKLRVQTGIRVEATDATYTANRVDATNPLAAPIAVPGSSGYINVLPSIQIQYNLTPNTNLRGSFGMGISRPNFSDIVPSQQVDANTSPYPQIVTGNPALKPTHANNYDLLVEHFFQPLGLLQAGFFYKSLSDPIYQTTLRHSPCDVTTQFTTPCDVIQSINGPSAHITGFEAAWEQRLSFLPGLLSGLGASANYSYTTSQVSFPTAFNGPDPTGLGRLDHPALQRQAPNTWNMGFTYDKSRFSMRFGVSHNDANIYQYFYAIPGYVDTVSAGSADRIKAVTADPVQGVKGPNGDVYLYAHTQFDVQGSYRIRKGLSVTAYGLNLSNEVFGFYQGSPQYPIQREYYHPTFSLGLRWTNAVEYETQY